MITKHQIIALRDEYEDLGFYKLVWLCGRALAGDTLAADICDSIISGDTITNSDLTADLWVA